MPKILAHFLPQLVHTEDLAGQTVVVLDILRATTTITYALAAGAARVMPCGEVEETRALARQLAATSSEQPLTGGERHGMPIEGFDLGNSPLDYWAERVANRTILFTTTNGTQAMLHCRQAAAVLIGSFVNLRAVVARVRDCDTVHLLCAGTGGTITREDVLAAGAITHRLMLPDDPQAAGAWSHCELNDEAKIARDAWQAALPPAELFSTEVSPAWLTRVLNETQGGRNLNRIGLERDIPDCAAVDRFDVLPELDVGSWEIRVSPKRAV